MNIRLLFLLAGLSAPLFAADPPAEAPRRIEIFTDSARPVENLATVRQRLGDATTIRYYLLDAQTQLEARLSKDLPAERAAARAIALQRIQALDRARIDRALSQAFAGVLQAGRYGIDRYPAVVFDDGEGVVYGITDLSEAVRRYRRRR